jgi:hypothetical protein
MRHDARLSPNKSQNILTKSSGKGNPAKEKIGYTTIETGDMTTNSKKVKIRNDELARLKKNLTRLSSNSTTFFLIFSPVYL